MIKPYKAIGLDEYFADAEHKAEMEARVEKELKYIGEGKYYWQVDGHGNFEIYTRQQLGNQIVVAIHDQNGTADNFKLEFRPAKTLTEAKQEVRIRLQSAVGELRLSLRLLKRMKQPKEQHEKTSSKKKKSKTKKT